MLKAVVRLEFKNVFPDENQEDLIFYIKKMSNKLLFNFIGFSNLRTHINYDNFFSDKNLCDEVIRRVEKYFNKKGIKTKPEVVSREASLKIGETILAHREELENRKGYNDYIANDELNLFKCYLIVNEELNNKQVFPDLESTNDKIADILISSSFSIADTGIYGNGDYELIKLGFCTIERFKLLRKFLESKSEYHFLSEALCEYFKQDNLNDLEYQITYFIGKLLIMKQKSQYKIVVIEEKSRRFIESLISKEIEIDDDYTHLRNHPLYLIDKNTYSIIDFFFSIDKFYKSVRFILKDSYNKNHGLSFKDRSFFNFYNTKFSEQILMQSVLDEIFHQKFLVKKASDNTSRSNEPDYYVRHNKNIFLFEFKDALISKKVKSSGDIKEIDKTLKEKFLFSHKNKPIGIGQLIESINQIVNRTFEYDLGLIKLKNVSIYPILLVSDRYLEVYGMNYKLNEWFKEEVKSKLKEKYNPNYIRSLTIIDIDTLIYGKSYLRSKQKYFKNFLSKHLHELNLNKKVSHKDQVIAEEIAKKNITNKLLPFSQRFYELRPNKDELKEALLSKSNSK